LPKTDSAVGIDLGITDFAVLSDGSRNDNNHFTRQMEERLRREQRKLARRALAAEKRGILCLKPGTIRSRDEGSKAP